MENKSKYFLIILFSLSILVGVVFFLTSPDNDCDTELDVYRWDLKVFKSESTQNIDSLVKKIKIEMDPLFSFTEADYKDLMNDQNFQIISDSTYNIFNTRLPYLEEINEGFCRYKEEFPDVEDPNIIVYLDDYITQVASPDFSPPFFPVDYNINNNDNTYWISLGLNWFLGEEHSFYQSIPDYLRLRYDSVYITPMIFHQIGYFHINVNMRSGGANLMNDETLLASMISTAKPYFFAKHMLPDVDDYRIFGFTLEEMDFAYDNEVLFLKDILLKEQLIYSSDRELKDLYIIPGPNLNCPTKLGTWLGVRILDAYFSNNDVSLQEILLELDFQKILNQSNYQP